MNWLKQGSMFTHHQKSVIVDTKTPNGVQLKAFMGGLDLCDGRSDQATLLFSGPQCPAERGDIFNPLL